MSVSGLSTFSASGLTLLLLVNTNVVYFIPHGKQARVVGLDTGVEGEVEGGAGTGVPVAVDVLGAADAPARRFVVGHHVANGVVGALEVAVGVETPVALVHRDAQA